MSNDSLGRVEVEEQHHVSSNPMQMSPGPSAQKKRGKREPQVSPSKEPYYQAREKGGK